MFNVRVKRFFDAEQVQIFSRVMRSEGEVSRKKFNPETGEIFVRKHFEKSDIAGEWMETPFTDYEDGIDFLFSMDDVIQKEADREESIRISCSRTVRAVYDIARANFWEWFITFTFNPDRVNRYDYNDCVKKFSKWLNNLKRFCPDIMYIVVPEQHKDGAFHFHGLFSNCDQLDFRESGYFDDQGRCIYNVGKYRFGFTTATRITDFHKASSYLCKYITKDLCSQTFGRKRYWASRNVSRPEVEEFLVEEEFLERLKSVIDGQETHIKQVRTDYTDVLYIDRPIYTTNVSRFFKSGLASDNE